jgi:hypothetical protein
MAEEKEKMRIERKKTREREREREGKENREEKKKNDVKSLVIHHFRSFNTKITSFNANRSKTIS